ncbi:kinesin light chain-like [Lytechinus pictus]|uniref:kinesin light chain-like n=1 Tax=Lytechinus pictus TaxID=7653 RepID=UPI00240DB71D|nr:kinesin light chain-like [Lytechinus pictus]
MSGSKPSTPNNSSGGQQNLSQEQIITGTREVIKGLEQLKNEHNDILNSLYQSLKMLKKDQPGDSNLVEEKTDIIEKSLESLELGLGEAKVSLHKHFIGTLKRRSLLHLKFENEELSAVTSVVLY